MVRPPMASPPSIAPEDRKKNDAGASLHQELAKEFSAHAAGGKLSALAFELVSRQAEARLLFSGKEYVERRAGEHGLSRSEAATSAGNLLSVLERGAENDAERALLAVATVRGLGAALDAADASDRPAIVARFVRHVDFLELGTTLSIWPALGTLDEAWRGLVHAELAQRVVDDGSGERGRSHAARGRNAARLSVLGRAAETEASASQALRDVLATRGLDAATGALAASLAPSTSMVPGGSSEILRGRLERPRASAVWRGLGLVTGVALLGWALRGLLALIGARREVDLRIANGGIELEERTRAFGRVLRQTKTSFTFPGVRSVMREVRFPRLHLYAGAIALALGVLVGGTWIFDGVRGGDFRLAALGAGVLLLGAVLDLVLDVLVPAQRGRVSVELAADRGRRVRVGDLALGDADAFVAALRARVGQR